MSEDTRTPEAKPGEPKADSLEAAAASFRSKLFSPPVGTKKTPGEDSPKPKGTPTPKVEATEDEEPEVIEDEESDETEEPEAEETDETPEQEETDVEPESEDEAPEEDETEETEPPRSRKVKLSDGTEEDVTEDEAYQGYLRTKDYTRKTQQAAEARKRAEAVELEASAKRAEYAEHLEKVKQAMDRLVPKEPIWAELRKTLTPEQFADTLADWQAFKKNRDEVETEQTRVAGEQAKKFTEDYEKYRKAEVEALLAAVPEWVDRDLGAREAGEMAKYAMSLGYTQEEVDHAVDHRMLLMLRKAMLWDKANTVGAGKVKPKVKPAVKGKIGTAGPGGKVSKPTPKSEVARAKESLRKDGSLDAAAGVFSHLLKRQPRR